MSSIQAVTSTPILKDYSGSWILNTATSIPTGTPVQPATAASQWTLIPALNNVNATSLLNSAGAMVIPVKGKWRIDYSCFLPATASMPEFQIWLVLKSASGQFAPRIGLQRQTGSSYNIGMLSTSCTLNLYPNDVIIPYVYQITGSAQTLQATTNGQNGTVDPSSTTGTVLSVQLQSLSQ